MAAERSVDGFLFPESGHVDTYGAFYFLDSKCSKEPLRRVTIPLDDEKTEEIRGFVRSGTLNVLEETCLVTSLEVRCVDTEENGYLRWVSTFRPPQIFIGSWKVAVRWDYIFPSTDSVFHVGIRLAHPILVGEWAHLRLAWDWDRSNSLPITVSVRWAPLSPDTELVLRLPCRSSNTLEATPRFLHLRNEKVYQVHFHSDPRGAAAERERSD